MHVENNYASGVVTNWSNQNVAINRINVVVNNQTLQIVTGLYLEPGQALKFTNAQIAGSRTKADG